MIAVLTGHGAIVDVLLASGAHVNTLNDVRSQCSCRYALHAEDGMHGSVNRHFQDNNTL